MKEIICLNAKFISKDKAKVSVLAPGVLYGWGLFETMRAYNNRIVFFCEHLERIRDSCRLLNLIFPYPLSGLKGIIKKAVKISGLKDAYVRLTLWKNMDGATDSLVVVRRYESFSAKRYRQGFSCLVSTLRQNENSFLARLKTTSYLLYQLSYLQAKECGFDEAIILNNRGHICEGSRSNIFLIQDKQIFTPALACSCLDGITRRAIFDLAKKSAIKISEGKFNLTDLYNSDELFLTNSLMGIMPLTRIGKKRVQKGTNKITKFLIEKYNRLLYGTKKDKPSL